MDIQSSEHILLTGAGFTKNFGAPLAIEMWAEIFNHKIIQDQPRIRELMKDDCHNFDYESIYSSIMEDVNYTEEERKAINDVMRFAYDNIDTILREYARSVPRPVELTNLNKFINHFNKNDFFIGPDNVMYGKDTKIKSFVFTLNQDMFFERLYSDFQLSIPGIKKNPDWFTSYFRNELCESDYCQLPDENELNHIKPNILSNGNFFIIKLHGSYNWKSFDGTQKMVIGRGKTEQIQKEPLLEYYFKLFKSVLFQKKRRLLIVGYGFGDEHINHIIADAVRDYELKIYIISPDSLNDFKSKLIKETKYGEYLWKGISGYFQHRLIEIFPENSSITTQASRDFYNNFF